MSPYKLYRKNDELSSNVSLVGRGLYSTGLKGEGAGVSDAKLRRATNKVSSVNDHFMEIIFNRGEEAGVTKLEGVGLAGDSGCPVFINERGTPYIAGLNSWGREAKGQSDIGTYGARDYQTRVSRYLSWIDSIKK